VRLSVGLLEFACERVGIDDAMVVAAGGDDLFANVILNVEQILCRQFPDHKAETTTTPVDSWDGSELKTATAWEIFLRLYSPEGIKRSIGSPIG
jgi:hypothetical protein